MINDREFKIRKKALVLFSLMATIFLGGFGYYNYFSGARALGIFEIGSAVVVALNLALFLVLKNYRLSSTVFLTVISVLFIVLLITGGIHNTGIFWLYLYPIISTFLKEPREALWWNISFTVLLFFVLIADSLGLISIPYDAVTVRQALVVYLSVLILSYFYSKLSTELVNSMKSLAVRDPLTGLYNRAFALSYLTQELEKVKRRELKNLCVAYIDLDNFKLVNDLLGHSVGDNVLSDIGALLRQHFRRGDVVARIGGDEFIIIFTNCDPRRIERRLELLRTKIENKFRKFGLSMSFGLAEAPKDALLPSFLVRIADERMYRNKKARKMARGEVKKVREASGEASNF